VEKSLIFLVYLSGERAAKFRVVSVTTVNKSEESRERKAESSVHIAGQERARKHEINVIIDIFMCAWSKEQ